VKSRLPGRMNHPPVWIDWNRAIDGGLHVIADTDEAGEPHLGSADLDSAGEMTAAPVYSPEPLSAWYHTGIFQTAPDKTELLRFTMKATGRGFTVAVRPLPSQQLRRRGPHRALVGRQPRNECLTRRGHAGRTTTKRSRPR
jgi:hypothetical protein